MEGSPEAGLSLALFSARMSKRTVLWALRLCTKACFCAFALWALCGLRLNLEAHTSLLTVALDVTSALKG